MSEAAAPPVPKLDPETLSIRTGPPRVSGPHGVDRLEC
jgi:hypothetical protein